eukprot:TRINITY_DN69674_c0_g1_i2.p1 TRINITY_DN69674_c0_g1~~TRINITY_DN69674_c0_g1_i2.p1  ORF type:complete len:102 (+),score=12.40 TRINITY_DN69674_c0_g1_i2:230-535(+)
MAHTLTRHTHTLTRRTHTHTHTPRSELHQCFIAFRLPTGSWCLMPAACAACCLLLAIHAIPVTDSSVEPLSHLIVSVPFPSICYVFHVMTLLSVLSHLSAH